MNIQHAMDDFLHYLEIEKNASPETIRAYAFDLHCFLRFLKESKRSLELKELKTATVRRYIQDQVINHNCKPRTLHRRISCLKSFSKYCCKEQWITDDFMVGIQPPKLDKKLPVYMKLSELQKFLRYLEKREHTCGLRDELMFKLLATTGMRRSECVSLTWDQIDLENNTVLIRGKGKKERLLPLHYLVIPLFKRYIDTLDEEKRHPDEPVFTTHRGKAFDPRSLHRLFKLLISQAGLPAHRFSLHHLRHTFATLLLQGTTGEKTDIRTLQELLGHENLSTVSVYTHINFDQKKKAIDSFYLDKR